MKSSLSFIMALLLGVSSHGAERKSVPATEKPAPPVEALYPAVASAKDLAFDRSKNRMPVEFNGDPIDLVIRTLARQAKINVVLSTEVRGTVNLRLDNQTPKEVIEVIVQANNLTMNELSGVYYIRHAEDLVKVDAKKVAREKKLLFDALLAEKFTREEAMQLVMHLQKSEKPAPEKPARARN